MKTDKIVIEQLEVYAYHGVFQEEKEKGQKFFVNCVLETNTREAGLSDNLKFSTHYGEVCKSIVTTMTSHKVDLIETVAEEVAGTILMEYPLVKSVVLEIQKPQAPIPYPFGFVSVKIERGWHEVALSIGANVGNKEETIQRAIAKMKATPIIRNILVSSLIETKPYGGVEQDDFINGAIVMETLMLPEELLTFLKQLEQEAGRVKTQHWGPRTLDIDILLYDDFIYSSRKLTIPHEDMVNRDFVLLPLAEIAAHLRHPVSKETVGFMLEKLKK